MAARSGNPVHQVMVKHEAKTLQEFREFLDSEDFVIVTEFYRDEHDKTNLFEKGDMILNTNLVGKVSLYLTTKR